MRRMFTKFAIALAPVAAASMVCATPAIARDKKDQSVEKYKPLIGKAYFIVPYAGLPGTPRRFITQNEVDIATYFDLICQGDLKAQRPNGVSEYFHSMLFGAAGAGGGYAAGYEAAGYNGQQVKSGAKLGVAFGLVSGLFQGIDGRKHANRYDIGQCMNLMISWAQQYDHTMLGIGVILNTHAVNGKGLKYLTIAESSTPLNANSNGSATNDAPTPAKPSIIP